MSDPKGITLTQAVAILGRSERSLRRLIKSGRIRAEKGATPTGPVWLLNPEDVAKMAEELPTPADPSADLPLIVARIEGVMMERWAGLVDDLRTELQEVRKAQVEDREIAQRREETLLEIMQANHEAEERRAKEQAAQLETLRAELAELKKPWWKWWRK